MRKYDELKRTKEDTISDLKIKTNNIRQLGRFSYSGVRYRQKAILDICPRGKYINGRIEVERS